GMGGGAQKKSKCDGIMLEVSREKPSVSAWLIAWRSMARFAASRTRRSWHGLFGSHCSAKETQYELLAIAGLWVSPGVRRSSWPSAAVTQYVMSISPRLSAAKRVEGSGMALKTSRFTDGVFRQYWSTASSTSSTPGVCETNR